MTCIFLLQIPSFPSRAISQGQEVLRRVLQRLLGLPQGGDHHDDRAVRERGDRETSQVRIVHSAGRGNCHHSGVLFK